jgi:hypothetical protein
MCFKKYYLPLETIASKHNLLFEKRGAFELGHLERLKMNRAEIQTYQKTAFRSISYIQTILRVSWDIEF